MFVNATSVLASKRWSKFIENQLATETPVISRQINLDLRLAT